MPPGRGAARQQPRRARGHLLLRPQLPQTAPTPAPPTPPPPPPPPCSTASWSSGAWARLQSARWCAACCRAARPRRWRPPRWRRRSCATAAARATRRACTTTASHSGGARSATRRCGGGWWWWWWWWRWRCWAAGQPASRQALRRVEPGCGAVPPPAALPAPPPPPAARPTLPHPGSSTPPPTPQLKQAISHAVAQSTKLSVYEQRVMDLVLRTRHLPQVGRKGRRAGGKGRPGMRQASPPPGTLEWIPQPPAPRTSPPAPHLLPHPSTARRRWRSTRAWPSRGARSRG
jgi:hypothetical protein